MTSPADQSLVAVAHPIAPPLLTIPWCLPLGEQVGLNHEVPQCNRASQRHERVFHDVAGHQLDSAEPTRERQLGQGRSEGEARADADARLQCARHDGR